MFYEYRWSYSIHHGYPILFLEGHLLAEFSSNTPAWKLVVTLKTAVSEIAPTPSITIPYITSLI